jgi:hypothetical protein
MIEVKGYERSTPAGGKIFAGRIPEDKGGGYSFVFTSPEGANTYLALSEDAFAALTFLYDDLNKPLLQTYKVLIQTLGEDVKTEWSLVNPGELPPEPAIP